MESPLPTAPFVLPPTIRSVLEALQEAGHDSWIVGGAIRDWLTGLPVTDWDVATSAHPERVLDLIPGALPVAIEHGTVIVPTSEGVVEVTTFRRGVRSKADQGDSGGEWGDSIDEDLRSRDLTVNAMAWRPGDDAQGILFDPFGGREDVATGVLRSVGDPRCRMKEDPLRALRVCRLVSILGFRVDVATEAAAREVVAACASCARERIGKEFSRILKSDHPGRGLSMAARLGLLELILPSADVDLRWLKCLDEVHGFAERLAVLTMGKGGRVRAREVAAQLLALRVPAKTVRVVEALITAHPLACPSPRATKPEIRRFIADHGGRWGIGAHMEVTGFSHRAGRRIVPHLNELRTRVDRIAASADPLSISELAVKGDDVCMIAGLEPGPAVGAALETLLQEVLRDPALNTRDGLCARLQELARSPRWWYAGRRCGRGTGGSIR